MLKQVALKMTFTPLGQLTKPVFVAAMACAVGAFGVAQTVQAQSRTGDYPSRAIKIISPHAPGGMGDTFARYLGQELSDAVGQPVIVENRPGGSQIIAAEAAARSAPDGYTLLIASQSAMVFNPVLRKSLPYDSQKDYTPISTLFHTPVYLVVNPSVPTKTVSELIDLAKASPDKYTYATLGFGSSHHLLTELFQKQAGIELLHVPYQGSAKASTDLIAGQVDIMFEGGTSSLPHVRAGKLIALASTGDKRTEIMPDLPALNETLPDFSENVWFGLAGPAGIPADIQKRLNEEVVKILNKPATHDKFRDIGVEILPSTPEEMATRITDEIGHWREIVTEAGIEQQ